MNIHGIQSVGTLTQETGGFATLSGSFTGSFRGDGSQLTGLPSQSFNTSSLLPTASFNAYTASTDIRLNNIELTTASLNTSVSNLNSATQSLQGQLTTIGGQSGSWITESETSSFARYDVSNPWSAPQTFTTITASNALITNLTTVYETSSIVYSSGSNQLGDELTDIQTLSGSVKVQGSLTVNGVGVQTSSVDISQLNQATASLQLFTQSAQISINELNTNSASVNTSISNLNQFSSSIKDITGSFATTGSNQFNGNQTITGSVYISSSTTNDLVVEGRVFISSSATSGTGTPQIVISGSQGQSTITRTSATFKNLTYQHTENPYLNDISVIGTADSIGITVSASAAAVPNWDLGPAIYVNNPSDTYPAVFGFQNKANYTDGRVAVLTPLSASAGFTASLQNGYTWVGNSLGQNTQVATSSFGTPIPAGTISSSAQITALGFVSSSITASSIVTASVNLNTITFTKGDASTFALTVNTGSGGSGAGFPFTGSAEITGSLAITGSLRGFTNTLSVVSSTASINMNDGNFFRLTLPTGSTTHVSVSNLSSGQTINLLVSQSLAATGSIAFAPNIKFAGGVDYTATAITGAMDIVSFVSFDTIQIFATQVKNLS